MKRIVAAVVAYMLASPAMADDGRTNVLIKFADVLAIAGRCDTLTPNMDMLKILAISFNIDVTTGTADHQLLEAMVKGKRSDLAGNSDEEVCGLGAMMYGRNGMNMKNLLVPK